MDKTEEIPRFHAILSDRDEWAIEAEWSDGTLERITTFKEHSAAVDWIANHSDAWVHVQRIDRIARDLKNVMEQHEGPLDG
jgi:hypothetical protein